jgi:hypothetical protein
MRRLAVALWLLSSCGSDSKDGDVTSPVVIGDAGTTYFGGTHSGNFWIGPVDYSESKFHNACGPSDGKYPALIQQLYGNNLMGLSNQLSLDKLAAGAGQLCDVCAELTANGKTLIAHAVTYGDETGVDDIDVSVEVNSALGGSTSTKLTWRFVTCPTPHPIYYTFDGREWSNTWYFRVWIRNARLPVAKVEYQLAGKSWAAMNRQDDGAWEVDSLDFSAGFSLRVTSLDGQTVVDAIPGIGTFDPNVGIASKTNFE